MDGAHRSAVFVWNDSESHERTVRQILGDLGLDVHCLKTQALNSTLGADARALARSVIYSDELGVRRGFHGVAEIGMCLHQRPRGAGVRREDGRLLETLACASAAAGRPARKPPPTSTT